MEHGQTFKWFKPNAAKLPVLNAPEPDELIYELPFEKYLAMSGCISSSGLRKIIKSPRHYIAEVMGFTDDDEDDEKDYLRFGRAAHMMVLEPAKFRQLYMVEPEFVGLTKDGRESTQSAEARKKKKEWWENRPADSVIVTQKEMDILSYMVDALMAHEQASNLLRNGKPEVTGIWTHRETGVRCRIRPDYLTWDGQGNLYVSDLKTTKDLSPGLFSNDAARMGYHIQLAFYADGVTQITGKQVESVALIAMEKKPPFDVAVYWLDDDDLAKGRQWYEFALRLYKRCLEKNEWPGRQGSGQMLKLPVWTDYEQFPQFEWRS